LNKLICIILASTIFLFPIKGLSSSVNNVKDTVLDEVYISLNLPYLGNIEIMSIVKQETLYLPIAELFDLLKIQHRVSLNSDTIQGFFIEPKDGYFFDQPNHRVIFHNQTYFLGNDAMMVSNGLLYLSAPWFGKIFGLAISFSFRDLSASLKTKLELPYIMKKKREEIRNNLEKLKGQPIADSTLKRKFIFFKAGEADWCIANSFSKDPTYTAQSKSGGIALGGILAGGEMNAQINYFTSGRYQSKDQVYRWHYVNDDWKLLKQISLGRIYTPSISTLFYPLNGVQISNSPSNASTSFGHYLISHITEPYWTVELYINNHLVDYKKADAAGFYSFSVPLSFGNSNIKIIQYGLWGEIRTTEQNMNIPYTFIAHRKLVYTLSAGKLEDPTHSVFTRANLAYGVSRFLSIGIGEEFLSSVNKKRPIPFLNASIRVGRDLIISAEYAKYISHKGTLIYYFKKGMQLNMSYIGYESGQTAVYYKYVNEKTASFIVPIHKDKWGGLFLLSYDGIVYPQAVFNRASLLLSTQISQVGFNISSYVLSSATNFANSRGYSNIRCTIFLKNHIKLSPEVEYQYHSNQLMMAGLAIEKRIGKYTYFNFSYQKNPAMQNNSFSMGIRFALPYLQGAGTVQQSNTGLVNSETASGSLLFNKKGLTFSNYNHIGSGRLRIFCFLDLNGNGQFDTGEPKLTGIILNTTTGGRIEFNKKDSSYSINHIIPYTNCFIEANDNGLENLAWKLQKKTFSIFVEPNIDQFLSIPVSIMGEIYGKVYKANNKGLEGLGHIKLEICTTDGTHIATVLTAEDGAFNYMGLPPGNYTLLPDADQLYKLNLRTNGSFTFSIKSKADGDVVDGLQLILF